MTILPLVAALLTSSVDSQPTTPTPVRIAIVAYEDFHHELEHFGRLFSELTRRDPSLRFKLAVGSYGDVLHWLDRNMVDLAVLTPGVFAGLLPPDGATSKIEPYRYLATVQLAKATSSWASSTRRSDEFSDSYGSICLVPADSKLRTVDDLRDMARRQRIEFLFVHPLSASGRAAPLEALRQAAITLDDARIRFTYSHSQSIRMLSEKSRDVQRVAFVWDDAAGNDPDLEKHVRKLSFPELNRLKIPHDVIVSRADYEHSDRVLRLLTGDVNHGQRYRLVRVDNWRRRFEEVRSWLNVQDQERMTEHGEITSLDEIGHLLLQYSRSQPQPPRLALVLSGGGAKCSYQVGAVAAIEQKFAQLRRDHPEHEIDIDLVVGTSGGAINSLPVALGISKTPEGQASLQATWEELDQCDIVRPSLLIRINMGLWFALLQTALVVWIVRWRVPDDNRRGWTFAAVYTMLAGTEILLGYVAPPPWNWLGTNHILHHTWLWLSFGVRASAWSLFTIGLAALALQAIRARRGKHIRLPHRFTKTMLATGLLGLPLLQLVTVLVLEETLSGGQGMEDALAQKFPRLINDHLQRHKLPKLESDAAVDSASTLQSVSRQIIRRGLLRRDLVITGSCLDQSSRELPSDLYFFAPTNSRTDGPSYGDRGLPLPSYPHTLLDVIMGSGSIYPVFPARRIEDIPVDGKHIELVDGGFAHNSPVEAAVLWGATHVILIDVMARGRIRRGNFLQNVTSSVQHLHRQAQLLDTRSRGKVTIFTLSPEPPHICIIDFANNLISASVELGYRDAVMDAATTTPRFRREFGAPYFVDIESRAP